MKAVIQSLGLCLLCSLTPAAETSFSDEDISKITFTRELGAQAPGTLGFFDETGKHVFLEDYFFKKPVILILGYYGCPVLCSLVANDVMENLRGLKAGSVQNFNLVYVSIDPLETPTLAYEKKKSYTRSYGGHSENWHFLTGNESSIKSLADAIGFHYAYDGAVKQFAHPAGFVILTPAGKVSHYLLGVTFSTKELNDALRDASTEKISPAASNFNLLCFHYTPLSGRYAGLVINIVRGGGVLTAVTLGWFLLLRKSASKPGVSQ